ncbi:hypothetical protein ACFLS9_10015, partial [Bacteroidota bacterium]
DMKKIILLSFVFICASVLFLNCQEPTEPLENKKNDGKKLLNPVKKSSNELNSEETYYPNFTVFVNADFTHLRDVVCWSWAEGNKVTLEIDMDLNGFHEFVGVTISPGDEFWFPGFPPSEEFSVSEGGVVYMYDELILKRLLVPYMTLEVVDGVNDMLSGSARVGETLVVTALGLYSQETVTAGDDGTWSISLPGIGPGSRGWVQIHDEDGEWTQIDWEIAIETSYPNFIVFVNADFTLFEDVLGCDWAEGNEVTLEVDQGADGFIDATRVGTSDGDETRFPDFPPYQEFGVSEGDIVRLYDDLVLKTLLVPYMTLEVVDGVNDILSGYSRVGRILYVNAFDPNIQETVTVEDDGSWSISLPGIGPGSSGWVQTHDEDGEQTQINWEIPTDILEVVVDIKPGSKGNSINPNSRGVIPVAIITTEGFDASTVNASTVRFGPEKASPKNNGHLEDVNGDGDTDLLLQFKTQETGIQCSDTEVVLTGQTLGGILFESIVNIKTVGVIRGN